MLYFQSITTRKPNDYTACIELKAQKRTGEQEKIKRTNEKSNNTQPKWTKWKLTCNNLTCRGLRSAYSQQNNNNNNKRRKMNMDKLNDRLWSCHNLQIGKCIRHNCVPHANAGYKKLCVRSTRNKNKHRNLNRAILFCSFFSSSECKCRRRLNASISLSIISGWFGFYLYWEFNQRPLQLWFCWLIDKYRLENSNIKTISTIATWLFRF